jgi:hypothetical protein
MEWRGTNWPAFANLPFIPVVCTLIVEPVQHGRMLDEMGKFSSLLLFLLFRPKPYRTRMAWRCIRPSPIQ